MAVLWLTICALALGNIAALWLVCSFYLRHKKTMTFLNKVESMNNDAIKLVAVAIKEHEDVLARLKAMHTAYEQLFKDYERIERELNSISNDRGTHPISLDPHHDRIMDAVETDH